MNNDPRTITPIRSRGAAGNAVRTYGEIAAELDRRLHWRITPTRVQQICARAEAKLARALKAWRD